VEVRVDGAGCFEHNRPRPDLAGWFGSSALRRPCRYPSEVTLPAAAQPLYEQRVPAGVHTVWPSLYVEV
jgi:hypothetical protein